MTELHLSLNETSETVPEPLQKPASRWKRATLAAVLSFVFTGAGQVYNRELSKAVILALVSYGLDLLALMTRLLFTFPTMIVTVLVLAGWKLFVVVEAAYTAAKNKPEPTVPRGPFYFPALAVVIIIALVLPLPNRSDSGFAAFKVPSLSMCPTICVGERFVADTRAYLTRPPARGDVIIMKHPSSDAPFTKRVIGVTGDTVAPGPDGSILVNGEMFKPPAPCGHSVLPANNPNPADYSRFQPITIPEGTFFVVGDNIGNSFDSRIPEFGAVTSEMLRGKPLYIYWSSNHSRIGCSLR